MSKNKTRENLFADFIEQLKARNKIKLLPFNMERWFSGSYSTIQRTLRGSFSPLSNADKSKCADILFREIPRLSGKNYDSKLKFLILNTAKDFNLSIGHAQKLVSILTKYAAACYNYPDARVPEDWKSFAQFEFGNLPVPIDAIVLYKLKQLYPEQFNDIVAGTARDKKGRPIYWAKVLKNGASQTWSRISDYDTYWSLQVRLRVLAEENNLAPLEFEMRHLWVAQ